MASPERLNRIVVRLIEAGQITPAMSQQAVETVYARVCEQERVPLWTEAGWESWETARPWGEGPNEDMQHFVAEVLQHVWGRVDDHPDHWPDEFPVADRELAAEIGCHPASLDDALWLRSQPEVWNHYLAIINDRRWGSEFHFRNLRFFAEAVRALGPKRVLRYPHAKTWAMVQLLENEGFHVEEALALHVAVATWRPHPIDPEEWRALARTYGVWRVARVFRALPLASRRAAELVLALPEAQDSSYVEEMAPWIEHTPVLTPERLQQAIATSEYAGIAGKHRWRLLAGQSPKEIADTVEPEAELSAEEAAEWLKRSNRYLSPGEYLCRNLDEQDVLALRRWTPEFDRPVIYRSLVEWYEYQMRVGDAATRQHLKRILDRVRPEDLTQGIHTPVMR